LEERVDARDASIPRVLEVFEGKTPVLRVRLLSLERILGPHALRVHELGLPGRHVPVEVGDQLVFFVAHARAEVRDAPVGLLREAQVALWDEDVAHREHPQTTNLLGCVEDDRWEALRKGRASGHEMRSERQSEMPSERQSDAIEGAI
jgi:hypothetical protein